MGRPPLGERAMTAAEKQRRYRARSWVTARPLLTRPPIIRGSKPASANWKPASVASKRRRSRGQRANRGKQCQSVSAMDHG